MVNYLKRISGKLSNKTIDFSGVSRAAGLFAARSIHSVISFTFSLIGGKLLSVEDHGLYSKALAWMVIVQAIAEVGLQYSLVRFLAPAVREGNKKNISSILIASFRLKVYSALFIGVVAWLLAGMGAAVILFPSVLLHGASLLDGEEIALLFLIALGGVGLSLISYFDALLVAYGDYVKLSLLLPTIGLFRLILLFVFAEWSNLRAEQVVFAYAMGPILAAFFFLYFLPKQEIEQPTKHELKPWIRKLFYFNIYVLLAAFFSIFSDWMEVLLIGDDRQTGLYNAARMPMQGFVIVLATMQSMILPRFSGLTERYEFKQAFLSIYKVLALTIPFFVGGVFVFAWFIPAWYGGEYAISVSVLYILYPSFVLRLFFAPLGTALFALDRPKLIAVEAGLRMTFGLALNLILIPLYGILGAAIASVVSQFAGWIFLLFSYGMFFRTGRLPLDSRPKQ